MRARAQRCCWPAAPLGPLEPEGTDLPGGHGQALGARGAAGPHEHVVEHGHRGKQRVALEQVAHAPALRGHVDAGGRVIQHPPVQHDAALVGALHAGDALERHALAAARGAEKRERLGGVLGLERDVKREVPKPLADVNRQAHARPPRVRARPSSQFMASSTTAEMATFTSTHLRASASSPVRHSW